MDTDYEQVKALYQHAEWYGGKFDEHRDSQEIMLHKVTADPQSIIVDEENGEILGTISLVEDGRVAWFYRFVTKDNNLGAAEALYKAASGVLKQRGHPEVLIYSDPTREDLNSRYQALGMEKGGDYECFYGAL
ncbi:MAG: hypothetical protein JWO47_30 [Candidatus Saccharibacteria bacterium]|nr:hypothetical protein [Candidatus Saccharibacteria bacterium]